MPSNRASKLADQARARARTVRPREAVARDLAQPRGTRPLQHKVVAVSLFPTELDWLGRTVEDLRRRARVARPNTSEIVRVALLDLRAKLDGKSPEEIRDYIADRSIAQSEAQQAS